MQDDTVQINLGYDASQALESLERAQAVIGDISVKTALTCAWETYRAAFDVLGVSVAPTFDKAVKVLADAGYGIYDVKRQVFVCRGWMNNPIAVHRILRYAEQPPTNRRRGRERRKITRRARLQAAKQPAEAVS